MSPGHTTLPVASMVSTPSGAASRGPTRLIVVPSIRTSAMASIWFAGSITRPFWMSMFPIAPLGLMRSLRPLSVEGGLDGPLRDLPQDRLRRQSRRSSAPPFLSSCVLSGPFTAGQQEQDTHPHGDALGDLVEDHRVRPVGDLRRELDAAIYGAGMHDQH